MYRYIVVKSQFEAIHCWPECPIEEVSFLRNPHRHIFYVTVKWKVGHNDREKEFIVMKRQLEAHIRKWYAGQDLGRMSCEDIAERIYECFDDAAFISVFEDNENGAEVVYE